MDYVSPLRFFLNVGDYKVLLRRFGTFLIHTTLAVLMAGCSMSAQIEALFSPSPIHIADAPKVNYSNQDAITVTGTCMEGVTSFVISSPPPTRTVNCIGGQWSVELDLSNEPEGPIRIVTDKINPNTGTAIEIQIPKDTVPPVLTSLILEQGKPITNKSVIAYRLMGEDIAQAYVTEDSSCQTGGTWQSALATVPVSMGDGSKTYYVKARDAAGNVSGCTLNASITYDTIPPVVAGLNDDFVVKGSKSWNWSCLDTYGPCEYTFSLSQSSFLDPVQMFSNSNTTSLASGDGIYYLAVQAKDVAGNISPVTRVQVSLSTNLPYLTIENGSLYNATNSVSLYLHNISNFDEVEISNTSACLSVTTRTVAALVPWTLAGGGGLKTISYRFKNTSTSELSSCYEASITVDNTAPVVTGLSDDLTLRKSKTWTWGCDDETPCSYRYVIDQSSGTLPNNTYGSSVTASQTLGDGVYYIHVQARDMLGNESAVVHARVTLDNTLPVLSGLSDSATPVKSKTWTWSCADTNTCHARFLVDQTPDTNPTGAYSNFMTATQGSGNGPYYIHVQMRDEAGNESAIAHYRAILDNTAPVITGLANDSVVAKEKTYNWSCTDDYGPCTYRYIIDQLPTTVPTGAYFSTTAATQNVGNGVHYLHVQARDVAGNESLQHVEFTLDNTILLASISSSASSSTNVSPIPFSVTFNKPVSDFTSSDVVISGGTLSGFTGSGTSYSFNVIPTAEGVVSVSVPQGAATDVVGNGNSATGVLSKTFDTTRPQVTLSSTAPANTNVAAIPVTATFSESVTNFTASDISITNGSISAFSGSGSVYSFTVTASSQGAVTVGIAAGLANDAAGNTNTAAVTLSRNYDNVRPSVTLSSTAVNPSNAATIPVAILFSEPITGFVAGDLTVTNGTVTSLSGSADSYSAVITPTAQGAVVIEVAANVAQDSATNLNTASNSLSITYDSVRPSVTLTTTAGATNESPIVYTATFSEAVTGFAVSDLSVVNGAATVSGTGTTYSVSVVPTASGNVSVTVNANGVTDAAGNLNTASAVVTRMYDVVNPIPPSVTNLTYVTDSSTAPSAMWFGASDGHSGISGYEVAIGTSAGASNVKAWASVGASTSSAVSGLSLSTNTDYYVSVRAVDGAGNNSSAVSGSAFRYFATPTISTVTPSSGAPAGGTTITVTGTNFVDSMTVTLGSSACTSVNVTSSTSFTCVTPSGTGSVTMTVSNPAGQSVGKGTAFTYAVILNQWSSHLSTFPGSVYTSPHKTASWMGTNLYYFNSSIYNVANHTWTMTSSSGRPAGITNDPAAVWSGSRMIIWGGSQNTTVYGSGAQLNPSTNSWTAMATSGAPSARRNPAYTWTGSKLFIWGGCTSLGQYTGCTSFTNTGSLYDPATNTWSAVSTTNAPSARAGALTLLYNNKIYVWGGSVNPYEIDMLVSGGVYDIATNTWTAMPTLNAPGDRLQPLVRVEDSKIAIWGGADTLGGEDLNTGSIFDASKGTWQTMTTTGAPLGGRAHGTLRFFENKIVVWGGRTSDNTGGIYNIDTNTWTATSTTGAPAGRMSLGSDIIQGSKLFVWGGADATNYINTGGVYDLNSGTWTITSVTNAPSARSKPLVLWTGDAVLVGAGNDINFTPVNTGALFK